MKVIKRYINYFLLGAISICSLVLPLVDTSFAAAASGNGFQIAPIRNEFTLAKGQSQTVELTITNPTSQAITARAVVDNFEASNNESGEPRVLLDGSVPDPTHNFIALVNKVPDVTLPPNGTKQVSVTVSVPANANPGGYYGVVRFVPVSTNGAGNVSLTASVGTLFLVTVPGKLTQKLQLTQLSAASNNSATSFIVSGTPQVLVRLDNVGNIHLEPFGTINVKDASGKTVASYQFNNATPPANILPGSVRKFVTDLPKRTWFGHYTIQASIAYANGSGVILNAKAGFWYFPVWFVIVAAVFIILLIAFVYWLVARRRRGGRHFRR